MLVSAGGSSGGRGLVSASGIDSPPSPSPPPAMRHAPRPRLPPPPSAESRASPPLKGRIVRLAERPQAAARRHPASLNGGIHAAEPPPPLWPPALRSRPAAAASYRRLGWQGSAPAAVAPRGSSSAPFAACRVRSRGDQLGRRLPVATSSVFSGAAGSRLRHGILQLLAAASCRRSAGAPPSARSAETPTFPHPKSAFRRRFSQKIEIRPSAAIVLVGGVW